MCVAYLNERNSEKAKEILDFVDTKNTPLARFHGVMDSIESWAKRTKYRGCQFINMVAEVPDRNSALREQGHLHHDWAKELVLKLTKELIASDKRRYGNLNAKDVTEAYITHLTGAIALAGVRYRIQSCPRGREAGIGLMLEQPAALNSLPR